MEKLQFIQSLSLRFPSQLPKNNQATSGESFATQLNNALNKVNQLQNESMQLSNQLVTGQIEDLHQLTIAAEKASIALDLTIQVRNKVIEAYQEMMRMQV